ncbi:MAG TPA: hypothetical protein VKQ32_29625 [Polyangia bacterium]|nr:hypothetical protein [Polyangia bacterium]
MSQRITRAFSVALGLCLAVAACDSQEDAPAGVDQPSPVDTTTQGGALMTAPSKSPRTIAAMMFDITGAGGTTASGAPNMTTIMNVIGGTGSSQKHMFEEISYGIQDTAPMYFGPYTLPVHNCLTIACCGPSSDQTGNGATVMQEISALPMTFNHYFWVYGKIPSGANCGTWGDEGSPSKIATYSSYSFHDIVGYSQEVGHNFGMTHEPAMCCGGTVSGNRTCSGGVTLSDDTSGCQHMEYANSLSFMGGGAHHPSAAHKYMQGWMSGCNYVKAGGSTTITILPQELPCNGVQLVQIPAPKTRNGPGIMGDRQGSAPMLTDYYLEMRAPYGFDSGITPQILLSIGPDLSPSNRAAPYIYLLDTNPGTSTLNDAGLTAGKSYSDPAGGLTITVNSIDMNSASVTITSSGTGGLTCGDASAFTAPGPDATSCGPLYGGGTSTGLGGSSGGRGGAGGSAGGRGGAGGTAGGSGGSSARGGAGGSAGGAAGSGAGGTATTGAAGTIGPGTGGSSTTGTGGSSTTGTGGSTVVTGTAGSSSTGTGGGGTPSEATGGCSCDTVAGAPSLATTVLGLLFGMITIARRRSRRAPID